MIAKTDSLQKTAFSDWINSALDCGIPQFKKCANTMINWLPGILNSFSSTITNGFTEDCNNMIKVLSVMLMVTEIGSILNVGVRKEPTK